MTVLNSPSHNKSSNEKFVVLFIPEPQGVSLSELKANIKRLFNMQDQQLQRLFQSKPTVIKAGADEDTALMYKRAIERSGGSCWVEPEQNDSQYTGSTQMTA